MGIVMNWEAKTAGEYETAAGNYRIVPEGREYVLIAHPDRSRTLDSGVWSKRVRSLDAAKEFPRVTESRQEVFVYKVWRAFKGATKTRQKELRRKFPTELQLVGLFADGYVTDEDHLTGNRRINALARELAVTQRL